GYGVLNYVPDRLLPSLLNAAPLAALAFIFAFARFSFGYFLGFGFYTMFLGYLWLSKSSPFDYDHWLGSISAFSSAIAFLLPALWITSPVRQIFVLSKDALDRMLTAILIGAAVVVVAGATYNFRLVGVSDIYQFRQQIEFPAPLRYAIGNLAGALLPFVFACCAVRGKPLRAAAALTLLLLLYPLTLTKLTLFAPFWVIYLAVLAWFCEARMAVVLSLLLPMLIGVALIVPSNLDVLSDEGFIAYFGAFNFRMIAVPSIALDLYSDYFSKHSLTHFCQLS